MAGFYADRLIKPPFKRLRRVRVRTHTHAHARTRGAADNESTTSSARTVRADAAR